MSLMQHLQWWQLSHQQYNADQFQSGLEHTDETTATMGDKILRNQIY